MNEGVDLLVARVRPKIKALLRTRSCYDMNDMLGQFKTHIWGLIEYQNGAMIHASESTLDKIERLQRSFVSELRITEEMAFLDFNFGPLCLRRDIGLLGFLHKRVLNQCHQGIQRLFPFKMGPSPFHDKQLESYMSQITCRQDLYFRSIFGLVHVYNRLPQNIVDLTSVQAFQSTLTKLARRRCLSWDANWRKAFRDCAELWTTLGFMAN